MFFHRKYIAALVFILISAKSYAQVKITANDGFEGVKRMEYPPDYWFNCEDGNSSADTQPGFWGVTKKASQGNSYVDLVTRVSKDPGTYETISSDLIQPVKKNVCYNLKISLCLSDEFYADVTGFGDTVHFFNSCVLRLYGLNGDCPSQDTSTFSIDTALLWQSTPVNNSDWRTFLINFSPKTNSFTKIAFQANFVNKYFFKNSALLIDDLRFSTTDNVFYFRDSILNLPSFAHNINWYFNDELLVDTTLHMPLKGSGNYQATFIDSSNCFIVTSVQHVDLPEEYFQIYPNPFNNFFTVKYFSYSNFETNILLIDLAGHIVFQKENVLLHEGNNYIFCNPTLLPASMYLCALTTKNKIFKVLKIKD